MAHDPLEEMCVTIAEELNQRDNWRLPSAGIRELARAILPYVRYTCERQDCVRCLRGEAVDGRCLARIQRIVCNYYRDGPMVEAMLTPGSIDGERLWSEWRAYVLAVAINHNRLSREEADEVTQTTFFQMRRALRAFRFESALKTYYWRVFANCYRQWLRDNRTPLEVELNTDDGEPGDEGLGPKPPAPGPGPAEEVTQSAQTAAMWQLITGDIAAIVGSRDYNILKLYYLEMDFVDPKTHEKKKWTDKEIGLRLGGVPPDTITSWRLRALKRVQQHPGMRERISQLLDTES